jgi:hypothetical protein
LHRAQNWLDANPGFLAIAGKANAITRTRLC